MTYDLQTLLHDALINNTYDYEDMHKTLDASLKSSFSYLYYLQKARVEYEELFRYSGEGYTRDFEKIGHLYLDSLNFANFDIDYDMIRITAKELFRASSYYFKFNHFIDLVENPDIFQKIPIVIIDDKVIWDYEIKITKDGATFKLPYRWDFVYEKLRNPKNGNDYVYIYHKIQVLIVDNCFYKRIGDNGSTINKNSIQNYSKRTITIPKSWLNTIDYYEVYDASGVKLNWRMTPTDFDHKYKDSAKTASFLINVPFGQTKRVNGYSIIYSGKNLYLYPKYHDLPDKSHGLMMVTLHYPTNTTFEYKVPKESVLDKMIGTEDHPLFDVITPEEVKKEIYEVECETKTKVMPKSFEMGTMLIPCEDKGDSYVGTLDVFQNDQLRDSTGNIYASCIFIEGLHTHENYRGSIYTSTFRRSGFGTKLCTDISVIEDPDNPGNPYNMPIPVENFMVLKTDKSTGKTSLVKNTDTIEMHYPNIYMIKDKNVKEGDYYTSMYFYYPMKDVKYTPLDYFYFKYIQDKFDNEDLEYLINTIYYELDEEFFDGWTDTQTEQFYNMFLEMWNYQYHIYKYGEADFLERYLKKYPDKTPIEYKDETLKEWMRDDPEILHQYVLHQNKLGSSYHLFTNQIDLSTRVRYNADLECGYRTKKFITISSNLLTATINVQDYVNSGSHTYYDDDGYYYVYNSSTKKYEYKGQIGRAKLENMMKETPNQFSAKTLTIGSGNDMIVPVTTYSYVDKNALNAYRWNGNKFVLYTETKIFDEPRYVFALNNDTKEFPYLLDVRVFVDGIMVIDCYHERYLYMDYLYIPCDMITDDSYIELEIFPRYSFKKNLKFTSMDDYNIITLVEPTDVIFPTLADFYVEDLTGNLPARISPSYFDVTVITDAKDTAYYENVDVAVGEALPESKIEEMRVAGEVVAMKLNDGTYVYMAADNIIYKYVKVVNGVRYYQAFRETVYYYVLKNHKWTKYLLDDGSVVQSNIAENDINTKNMKKGRAKLYLEAKDLHATEDSDPYPVKYARLTMIKIKPKQKEILNKNLMFFINKNPQGIPLVVDRSGYPFLEITGKDFNFNKDYLRVFVNGRLLPRCKYDFYTTMYCPRLAIYEWVKKGDFIYLDVSPYRYKEIYYSEEIDKKKTLIDLRGIITKPFDIRYYDVYMNGRKLSLNNVFSVDTWFMTLVNLKSQYHLTIYERDRDWEWYGLNYKEDIYAFSYTKLWNHSFVTQDEINEMIKDIIDKKKDYRLNIVPNEFTEEKMNYNDDFKDATDFFIFYYYELLPKGYLNPDRLQVSTEVMTENFPDVYKVHKTTCYDQDHQDDEQKTRRKKYTDVLYLNPDVITPGREVYFDSSMNYYKYTENTKLYTYFTKEGVENSSKSLTQSQLNAAVAAGTLRKGRITMTYVVGHPDNNIPKEILDDSSSIKIPTTENITKKGV